MASACVNNVTVSQDTFPATYSSYGWLSPRVSFGRDEDKTSKKNANVPDPSTKHNLDPECSENDLGDFEFRLDDPVMMLPADELFSDGKLVPLHLSMIRQSVSTSTTPTCIMSPENVKSLRRSDATGVDPYLFSPKAPRCSSRWKELLGLRKLYLNSNAAAKQEKMDQQKTASQNLIKQFLHRSSKSADSTLGLNLPLLKDVDSESVSVSSRLSLSSSSSGHDLDDLPRLSLDSEKPAKVNVPSHPPRMRLVKTKESFSNLSTAARVGRNLIGKSVEPTLTSTAVARGLSVDSPRMNSSGKIVFHGLERSSSSPSSIGGPKFKHRGMERSYSANVRITPVLNVPVCSLRGSSKFGFPLFSSSQQKREGGNGNGNGNRGNKGQSPTTKHRSVRSS